MQENKRLKVKIKVRLNDLGGIFQFKRFCDSVIKQNKDQGNNINKWQPRDLNRAQENKRWVGWVREYSNEELIHVDQHSEKGEI